jgi:hypothetical protein
MARLASALLWAATSAALLLAGLFALGLLVARGLSSGAAGLVFRAIAQQALLPLWFAALASWLVLAWLAPALERSWSRLALGVVGVAAAWFPLVGEYSFLVWQPTGPRDYFATWLLLSGGVAAALLLTRRAFPALRPGAFARSESGP